MGVTQFFKRLLPLYGQAREDFESVESFLTDRQAKEIRNLFKLGEVDLEHDTVGTERLDVEKTFPKLIGDASVVEQVNDKIRRRHKREAFDDFADDADQTVQEMIAPHIVGMHAVKEAVLLQLFSQERTHVLLLGDPGTGKTDILRGAADLAPKSSFGLGSGTSGVGLTLTVQGDEIIEGLLPQAHEGLCCIDELNLLKGSDRAGLLNAMEKGFVSYDKGNKHVQVDADVKVLGTANPKGDQFSGETVAELKKQVPFDPALLTRFHLVFLVRKPDTEEFKDITKEIVSGETTEFSDEDEAFVRDYIEHVMQGEVSFDDDLEPMITDFVEDVKEHEDDYLIDVSPRIVVGAMRLAKASARVNSRGTTAEEDVRRALDLIKESLVST